MSNMDFTSFKQYTKNKTIHDGLAMMTMDERNEFIFQITKKLAEPNLQFSGKHHRENYIISGINEWLKQRASIQKLNLQDTSKNGAPPAAESSNSRIVSTPAHVSSSTATEDSNGSTSTKDPNEFLNEFSNVHISKEEIGPYIVLKTLGQGTFGKVKLCQRKDTKQLVAIKIIQKENVKTQKQRNSVQREVRLMKLLWHPNIIHVYDVFEDEKRIFIIMEYASGGELFDYIVAKGRLKEGESRRFFRQIISAVDYCHKNSIIHRDLKPENMLLDKDNNIKIIDFGFGNTFHLNRQLDTYCGSPFYAAPEMIKGHPYCGPEVDIWSLGVILYALLSGHLPFDAPLIGDLYKQIGKGDYVIPPHFNKYTIHVIRRMLTVDSSKRATLSEIMNHCWVTNYGSEPPPSNFLQPRASIVTSPNPNSIAELVSYGIGEQEIRKVLSEETGQHPISSLFHMVDEVFRRKEKQALAKNQHYAPTMVFKASSELKPIRSGAFPKPTLSVDDSYDTSRRPSICSTDGHRAGVYRPGVTAVSAVEPKPEIHQHKLPTYNVPRSAFNPHPQNELPQQQPNVTIFTPSKASIFKSDRKTPKHINNIPDHNKSSALISTVSTPNQAPEYNFDSETMVDLYSLVGNEKQTTKNSPSSAKINVQTKIFGDQLKAIIEKDFDTVGKEMERILSANKIAYYFSTVEGGFVCEDKSGNAAPNFTIEMKGKKINNEDCTMINFKSSRTAWSMQFKNGNAKKLYQWILSQIDV